uniref:Ig-like domain-containing protein n=1 Tax=Oncorhynchus tshawytscha TaxID=74940 RepID=A0AAZ3RP16_ONCTS
QCSLLLCCLCLSVEVHQTPSAVFSRPGENVQLFCQHPKTDYRVILWYQKTRGETALKLIGNLYHKNPTIESSYEKHFNMSGDLGGGGPKNASLNIVSNLTQEDSAVYFCAAREHSPVHCANYEAHFGQGTKLTVLNPNIKVTEPTVKVLAPSAKECEDRNKKKKKTLVCVATRFYPDHVTVFWQVNNVNRTEGAGTDNRALWDKDGLYSITSRLRVPANEWHKPENRFTCNVSFYNGTDNIQVNDTIRGDLQGNKTMNTVCVSEKQDI